MENELSKKWLSNLEVLDVAFQPIINIHTGRIFGVEALLRNFQDIGFVSIFSLFDAVYEENLLYSFDIKLREKTFKKFTKIDGYENIKLFYNLDNRLFEMPNFTSGNTDKFLKFFNMKKENICFEISERHEIANIHNMEKVLRHYKESEYSIAIDDFGVGYSGYKLLYDTLPDIIKIDRFFLTNIEKNMKKKIMVKSITQLAIQLGIKVIAEGVETKEELLVCRDVGCHLVQGYLIQKPTTEIKKISQEYKDTLSILQSDKRTKSSGFKLGGYMQDIPSLPVDACMSLVIEHFRKKPDVQILPIVNLNDEPIGILHESSIKEFLYSPYGRSLMINDDKKKSKLKNLIQPCGVADIYSSMSTIIELFSNNPESMGIILTKNFKYYGFLSARAIITVMNEQNLLFAVEQNPLTKLPGNAMIEKYIADVDSNKNSYILCYFDLDNFKAFNDAYGFRNGDRVIQFFADMLRTNLSQDFFKAHIGGDDFFIASQYTKKDRFDYIKEIFDIVAKFTDDAQNFYSKEDRENGFIVASDRDGAKKTFPLLTVSASVLMIDKKTKKRCQDSINKILSVQKKVAKTESSHISISTLL